MSGNDDWQVNRRDFLQTGAMATASAVTLASGSAVAAPPASKPTLPRRPLGKTGVDVTMLNQGAWQSPGLDRLLRFAYANGVRNFDTAKSYGSEPAIARGSRRCPRSARRSSWSPRTTPTRPGSSSSSSTSGWRPSRPTTSTSSSSTASATASYGEASLDWPKSKEFKETAEAIKKSGKAKFVGFSCHHPRRAEILQAAAEGGFVDAIMLQYTPWLDKDAPLNRALDAC